ncbi:MAG: peptidoglycan-binding protein [Actinomycetota bacterium]
MHRTVGVVAASLLLVVADARAEETPSPFGAPAPAAAVASGRSQAVAEVQRRLKALGYPVGPVDGVLGAKTRGAIDLYLGDRGLPAAGWLTPELMAEIEAGRPAAPASAPSEPPLPQPAPAPATVSGGEGRGMPVARTPRPRSGGIVNPRLRDTDPAQVMVVQRGLAERGHYHGPIDGVVGPELTAAIKDYEAAAGRPVTGWIFPDLVAELGAPAKAPEPAPEPTPAPAAEPAPTVQPKDLIGKSVHARAGDLLGRISQVVVDPSGAMVGVVVGITSLYGRNVGETLIPWAQVAPWAGRAAIVLPLTAEQAMALRRDPPPFQPASGQTAVTAD